MEIAYGQHVVSEDDPYLQIANRLNTFLADAGMQGTHPVDVFPIRELSVLVSIRELITRRR